jgi:hypothetical protein
MSQSLQLRVILALLVAVALSAPVHASAVLTPTAQICVSPAGTQNGVIPTIAVENGAQPYCTGATVTPDSLDPKLFNLAATSEFQGMWSATLEATANIDPFIQYAVAVTNNTDNPLQFLVSLFTPIVAVPYDRYEGEVQGMLTDGQTNGVLLETVGGDLIVTNYAGGNFLFATGGGKNTPGAFGGSVSITVIPQVYDSLAVDIAFILSGGGDSLTISGRSEVFPARQDEIPEPGTSLLFGTGLLGFLAFRRFRAQ